MHPTFIRAAGLVSLGWVSACGLITDSSGPAEIRVSMSEVSLRARDSVRLSAVVIDDGGDRILPVRLEWSSSDTSVATVDFTGLLMGVGAGSAEIRVTTGGRVGVAFVSVEPRGFTSLSLGDDQSCGITVSRRAYCWGHNGGSGLGTGEDSPDLLSPTLVQGDIEFSSISVGIHHVCGISTEGEAYCWGANPDGRLGVGDTDSRTGPSTVLGNGKFTAISAGDDHTCAVDESGRAYCWGSNWFSQLGLGESERRTERHVPTPVLTDVLFSSIDAGRTSTCGVSTGEAGYCWGDGALGTEGDLFDRGSWVGFTPIEIPAFQWRDVQTSKFLLMNSQIWAISCGLDVLGALYCWQNQEWGGIGVDPALIGAGPFEAMSLENLRVCALPASGEPFCRNAGRWNDPGRPMGIPFVSVERGAFHTCGLTANGLAYCWGSNRSGELGNGTIDSSGLGVDEPVQVVEPE
ncbi:MAG: Ig-like domain-containing protein [Gemmatimonadota bacterium]